MTKGKRRGMIYNYFISHKRKNRLAANCRSCPNVALALRTFLTLDNIQTSSCCARLIEKFFRYSFDAPSILLWLSCCSLKWFRSVFLDEPCGRSTSGFPSKARLPAFRLFPKGLKKAAKKARWSCEDMRCSRTLVPL